MMDGENDSKNIPIKKDSENVPVDLESKDIPVEESKNNVVKVKPPKKPGFFRRLSQRFSTIFRRKPRHRSVQSDPVDLQKPENLETPDVESPINKETEEVKSFTPPPAKVLIFSKDLTLELKNKLHQRSKDIDEGEKSPTEAIENLEHMRSLAAEMQEKSKKEAETDSQYLTDEMNEESERRTVEERVALYESQISAGSGSMVSSLQRPDKRLSGMVKERDEMNVEETAEEEMTENKNMEITNKEDKIDQKVGDENALEISESNHDNDVKHEENLDATHKIMIRNDTSESVEHNEIDHVIETEDNSEQNMLDKAPEDLHSTELNDEFNKEQINLDKLPENVEINNIVDVDDKDLQTTDKELEELNITDGEVIIEDGKVDNSIGNCVDPSNLYNDDNIKEPQNTEESNEPQNTEKSNEPDEQQTNIEDTDSNKHSNNNNVINDHIEQIDINTIPPETFVENQLISPMKNHNNDDMNTSECNGNHLKENGSATKDENSSSELIE